MLVLVKFLKSALNKMVGEIDEDWGHASFRGD
jgi:hypothetical protein